MNLKLIISCVAAGAAMGMLMAPDSGEKTRQKINDKLSDLKDKWKHMKSITVEELDELKEIFQQEISGLKSNTRERVLEIIDAMKQSGNKLKEQALV